VKVATPSLTKCRSNRRGTLKRVRSGPDAIIRSFTTNDRGVSKMGFKHPKGKYYVKVRERRFATSNGTQITCKATRSPNLSLP
jgi:hypothetical protein